MLRRYSAYAAMLLFCVATVACDEDNTNDPSDAGTDLVEEVLEGEPCATSEDCPRTEHCNAEFNVCAPNPTCNGLSAWASCVTAINNAAEEGAGELATCIEGVCTRLCRVDTDCGEGEVCTDFGSCQPFTGDSLNELDEIETAGSLQAGYGEALLNYPIGMPLGGYGSRAGSRTGRYGVSLISSSGTLNGQYARAVALENGLEELIIVRVPMIFTPAQIHERVARRLNEEFEGNWRDSLVISATHTHSGPARLWRLPRQAALDLGILGAGTFSQTLEDWLVESIADAAIAAWEARQPASLGWKIIEAFDMENSVGRDRWSQTPPFDLNRLLLMRVDDENGDPIAVLFSYAAHGTDNSTDYATDDVLGGAEHGLSAALSEHYGVHVPTLFLAEGGGSMSPASGSIGHRWPHTRERAGAVIVEKALQEIIDIDPTDTISLRARTSRFPLTYEGIGYAPGEYGRGSLPLGGTYINGAIQCGGGPWGDEDYETYTTDAQLNCIALRFLLFNQQPTPLTRTQLTAIEIDGLNIITLPGEATQEVTWQALDRLRDDHGLSPAQSWVLSYAQDHLLYLTPTNLRGDAPDIAGYDGPAPDSYPDFAFSARQGGYEPSLAPWGPRFGDHLNDLVSETWSNLENSTPITNYPAQNTALAPDDFPMDATPDASIGGRVINIPPVVSRLQSIEFGWVGGDPGAEAPQAPLVTLEVYDEDAESWSEVEAPTLQPYTNRLPYFATRLRQAGTDANPSYEWIVRWQPPVDFPLGLYRLRINGNYLSASTSERTPYETTSEEFEVVAGDFIDVQGELNGDTVNFTISYPAAQPLNFDVVGDEDPGALSGDLHPRSTEVATGLPAPVRLSEDLRPQDVSIDVDLGGSIVGASVTLETTYETVGGRSNVRVTRGTATSPGGETVESATFTVLDRYGNTGEGTID